MCRKCTASAHDADRCGNSAKCLVCIEEHITGAWKREKQEKEERMLKVQQTWMVRRQKEWQILNGILEVPDEEDPNERKYTYRCNVSDKKRKMPF